MSHISGIAYSLGTRKPIGDLPELAKEPETLQFLSERGFRTFCQSHKAPWELAVEAARETLRTTGLAPGDVDEIIFASTTAARHVAGRADDGVGGLDEGVGKFAVALEVIRTPVTGICFGECANAVHALEVADLKVRAGRSRRVLVVSTDAACTRADRLPLASTGVCGDGAAACVVSHEPLGSGPTFELQGISMSFHHAARAGQSSSAGQMFRDICIGARNCLRNIGVEGNVSKWIPNNSNEEVVGAMASVLGLRLKDMYMENLARNAHVFSADQFINLIDWTRQEEPQKGSSIVGIATGVSVCAAVSWKLSGLGERG